jgi:redox-sensitive bicupin YhaK (pirin superfamily)
VKSQAKVENGVARSRIEDNDWELFVDEDQEAGFFDHMSDKVQVQFLGEDWESGPWIVPNRFPPNCKAAKHAHNFDTIYYILKGTMSFNDGSGWYSAGDLRWVRKGTTYGPEEAGPDGCEFLLVSYGPINIEWEGGDTYEAGAAA